MKNNNHVFPQKKIQKTDEIYPGILPVDKPLNYTSFSIVHALRKKTGIQKIGHAGTLDPFATGVMIMLIGREFTKLSDQFLNMDKEYLAQVHLGVSTTTYDREGAVVSTSDRIPSLLEIEKTLSAFQGNLLQIPPMFSAKKIQGKKLYQLARKGIEIERKAEAISVTIQLISYEYPFLSLRIQCSKGTYIRSLANDIGNHLQIGAHLGQLVRTRCGNFNLEESFDIKEIL